MATALHQAHLGASQTKVIAVTSGKGGVGKTTVSINLALSLAKSGKQVMLLDADLGLANVDVMLGLKSKQTLEHVIDGSCSLDDVLIDGPEGIRIIPAASGVQRMAELEMGERAGLVHAFGTLADEPDYLIVDTAAGIAANTLDFCTAAHEVLVVVCDNPASITDAYASIKLIHQQAGRDRFRIAVNMVDNRQNALDLFSRLYGVTDRYLDVSLDFAGVIPNDPNISRALARRRAVVELSPGSAASLGFKDLAVAADKWPTPSVASGRIEFFVERLAHAESFGRVVQQ